MWLLADEDAIGIIPAYAGSTSLRIVATSRRRDHPRIRGEHDTPLTNVTPFTGSSPHTRGARVKLSYM